MIKNKKILIVGAGGFIGGHLVNRLLQDGNSIIAVDIKPKEYWFQEFENVKNHYSMDMKDIHNCRKVTKDTDFVFNMACNMGGMGFIENNKAECMLSVLINTNLLRACKINSVSKLLYSSSACIYNTDLQQETFVDGLKEHQAYPANPEDGYGWEKLFSERMYLTFNRNFKLEVRIARYHNIYGPLGTWNNGKEKAPAAICRKVAEVSGGSGEIEVWGDGKQTRSFLYIDECIKASLALMRSNKLGPYNIGSEEMVSINELVQIASSIAQKKIKINNIKLVGK